MLLSAAPTASIAATRYRVAHRGPTKLIVHSGTSTTADHNAILKGHGWKPAAVRGDERSLTNRAPKSHEQEVIASVLGCRAGPVSPDSRPLVPSDQRQSRVLLQLRQ